MKPYFGHIKTKKMNTKKLQYQGLITLFSVIIIITAMNISSVYADPSSLPPTGLVDVVLHEGADAQTKAGPLTINDNLHGETINATQINANNLCLSGDCRNIWPAPDLTVQNLDTVISHSGTMSSGNLNFSGVGMYVNGVYRSTFPKPTFSGWSGLTTSVRPSFCAWGFGPICVGSYDKMNGAIVGFAADYWAFIAFATFAETLTIGTD